MRLQLLENELLSITQKNLAIPQYFHKVRSLCREIGDLDPQARIGEARMKRIIVHGLKPEFQSFVAAVQGWPNQPSVAEFENLLASQEALAKQMSDVSVSGSVKQESEALYASKGKRNSGFRTKGAEDSRVNNNNKREQKEWSGDQKQGNWNKKKKTVKCYNCGRRGHIARDCPSKPQEEGNVAEAEPRVEPTWDAEANFTQTVTKSVHALVATTESLSNKIQDWIVDSGCSNHMTGDKSRLKDPIKYKGNQVVVIADNSRHGIEHIGDVELFPGSKSDMLLLKDVFHVPGMKKNLLSIPQITDTGRYVLFGPKEVMIF
ncbi:uncharacterized protein LOC143536225 [Bidens hawaiensis]|uniref:uncharacterized protein LOC143536225 n=1 Tax=Bidens hawaiensis TaxID=980011 RepID=UPI0040490C94